MNTNTNIHSTEFLCHILMHMEISLFQVFQLLGPKAQSDIMNSLLNLRNEIGLLGVVKLPEFTQTIAIMAEEKELDEIIRYYFETTENENVLCQPENFKELTYRMWTLSKRNQVDMELFQCIYNNSHAILRNPEVFNV